MRATLSPGRGLTACRAGLILIDMKTYLMPELNAWQATHPVKGNLLGFLLREHTASGLLTHRVDARLFDGLDSQSKAKDWPKRLTGPLRSVCGLDDFTFDDLWPAYARPLCQACAAQEGSAS